MEAEDTTQHLIWVQFWILWKDHQGMNDMHNKPKGQFICSLHVHTNNWSNKINQQTNFQKVSSKCLIFVQLLFFHH